MGVISTIKSWLRKVSGGGSSRSSRSSSSYRRKAPTSYYRSYKNSGGYVTGNSNVGYEDPKVTAARKARERQSSAVKQFAAISRQKSDIERKYTPRNSTSNGYSLALKKLGEKASPPDAKLKQDQIVKSRADATKMLAKIDAKAKGAEAKLNRTEKRIINKHEAEQKEFNRVTNNKYNAHTGNKEHDARARQRIKSGDYQGDPNVEKFEVKYHPKRTSFTRGALSGTTFGASEVLAKKSKKRQQTGVEQYYQANKRKGYEFAGDIAGSLASFGLTSEGSVRAIGKLAPSLVNPTEKTVARYAGKRLIKKAAEREMRRAVKSGLVKEGSEELLEQLVKDRARRIAVGVGKDRAINTTTGLLASGLHSYADSENLADFGKEMAVNVPLNYALGGVFTVAPELRVGRGFLGIRGGLREEAANVVSRYADDVARAAERTAPPQTLDDAVERAAVDAVEAREAVANQGLAPTEGVSILDDEAAAIAREQNVPTNAMPEPVAPRAEAEPATPKTKTKSKSKSKPKPKTETKPKAVDRDALRKELQSNHEEMNRIEREILDEYGEMNPDWGKLSAEERASLAAKKNRYGELDKRNNAIGKELSESARASASETKKDIGKPRREELESVEAEYKKVRNSLKRDSKKISEGKEVDLAAYEAKEARLKELEDRRDALRRELGTQAKPRKTRSDAGKPKAKAPVTEETAPTVDVAEGVKQAEAKPLPKYEDIDLSKGLTEDERSVISSKMKELDAERNRLLATDENNPRVEELGAEISNIKRALKRDVGEPAKAVDIEAHNAEQAAKEAQAKAEQKANAKPIKNAEESAPKAETKPKTKKQKKSEAAKKAKRDAQLETAHAEYAKNVKAQTGGEYAANKTIVGTGKAESANAERNLIGKIRELNRLSVESGETDLKHAHVVKGADYETKLARNSIDKVSKDRASVEKRLKSLLKEVNEAEKTGEIKYVNEQDMSDAWEVINSYERQGKEVPKKLMDSLEQLFDKQGTQHGQGLRMIRTMRMSRSTEYRKAFATRDLTAYAKRFGSGDVDLKKISASMKAKTGKSLEERIDDWAREGKNLSREEQEKMYADLQIDIFRHTEPSIMDTINLWRHMFLLSKPTTALNNILGNTFMYTMSGINDRTRYYAEKALRAQFGDAVERTTTLTKNINSDGRKLMSWGAKNASYEDKVFADEINNAVDKAVKRIMGDNKWQMNLEKGLDFDYGRSVFAQTKGFMTKLGAKGNKGVGLMLNKPDEWFVEKNYRAQLIKYLYANGVDSAEKLAKSPELLARAEDHATKMAKENTFKSASQLVNMLDRFRQSSYKKGSPLYKKIAAMVMDANIPFTKVPINLVKVNFKYSPIGLVWNSGAAARALATAKTAAKNGDTEAFNLALQTLEKHTGELSKGLTGTGLAALGFFLNCDDATDDKSWGFIAKADEVLKEYNVRDYSFKIGNKNLNLANTGIGTIQFLIGAQYAEEVNKHGGLPKMLRDDPTSIITSLAMTFAPISDMSLLDNLVDSMKSFTYGSSNDDWNIVTGLGNVLEQSAGNYAGQFVPSPLRAIARGTTSADLDTGVKRGASNTQRVKNNLISGVPVLNEKKLPHRVDTHGNLINEKKTNADKLVGEGGVLQNLVDPFSTRTINIPKADKVELKVKNANGKSFKPKAFDAKREYQAKIGKGKNAEYYDLTGKEREQVARSAKYSGYDMGTNVVRHGWFGDTHGERAQTVLNGIPDDEEKAREYLYNTPEFKALSDSEKIEFFNDIYGTGQGRNNSGKGRARTENYEAYVNVKGGSEGDFKFQNDLEPSYQNKYNEKGLAQAGIDKGHWADIVMAAKYESHKYKDGKNVDTIQAYGLKKALLEDESLTTEQRIALYQAERGKRNGFGWYDWNGVSLKGYYKRGRRYRGWRRRRYGSSKKAKVPTPKTIKANSFAKGTALGSTTKSKSSTTSSAKATPPTLKRVQAKIDLPTARKEY